MERVKILHYCWFGRNPLPELTLKCIESWKKYCPDWEIKEWNEDNFDINDCIYAKEAYAAKKWAFVSDYCRYVILHRYGGIYLDTDVELIKPIDDLPENFVGFEDRQKVASGLIRGAVPGDELCAEMIQQYLQDRFILADGRQNKRTVCERETDLLKEKGLIQNNKKQEVMNTTVFPSEYFSPKNYITQKIEITENTYSIHHYDSSWYGEEDKYAIVLRTKYSRILPERVALRLSKFVAVIKYRGIGAAIKETIAFIKR